MNDFVAALENGDLENSDYGLGPVTKTERLDSVKYVSDTVAVIYTTSSWTYSSRQSVKKDTVYNHPLFSKKHSLDSIKHVLKTDYSYKNTVDSAKFIGFDNGAFKKTKKSKRNSFIVPFFNSDNDDGSLDKNALLAFGLTFGFVISVGIIFRKIYRSNLFANFHTDAVQSLT